MSRARECLVCPGEATRSSGYCGFHDDMRIQSAISVMASRIQLNLDCSFAEDAVASVDAAEELVAALARRAKIGGAS